MDIREYKKEDIITNPVEAAYLIGHNYGVSVRKLSNLRRATPHHLRARRVIVWALYMYSRLSMAEIAKIINVSRLSLYKDCERTKSLLSDKSFLDEIKEAVGDYINKKFDLI